MTVKTPKWTPGQMTTGELARARAELEHRLAEPLSDARKQELRDDLTAVIAEQTRRQKTTVIIPAHSRRGGSGRRPGGAGGRNHRDGPDGKPGQCSGACAWLIWPLAHLGLTSR